MSESNEKDPQNPEIPRVLLGHEVPVLEPIPAPVILKPYSESEDHVPDPTAMTGTLETSGVGGGSHSRLGGVAGIFGASVSQPTVERDGLAEHEAVPEQIVTIEDASDPSTEGEDPSQTEDDTEADKGDEQGSKTAARRAAKKAPPAPDTTKK